MGEVFLKENEINHFGSVLSKQGIGKALAIMCKRNFRGIRCFAIQFGLLSQEGIIEKSLCS